MMDVAKDREMHLLGKSTKHDKIWDLSCFIQNLTHYYPYFLLLEGKLSATNHSSDGDFSE